MSSIERLESTSRLSRVVVHDGIAFFSGLTASNRSAGVEAQTREILSKADGLLQKIGENRSKILNAMIWLRDISDFDLMNSVWEGWIDPENPPARATVQARLAADDIAIEVQFIVAVD